MKPIKISQLYVAYYQVKLCVFLVCKTVLVGIICTTTTTCVKHRVFVLVPLLLPNADSIYKTESEIIAIPLLQFLSNIQGRHFSSNKADQTYSALSYTDISIIGT